MLIKTDVPVWVDISRCKACDICVSRCPAGVLAMAVEPRAVLGKTIEVVHPEACIGCRECELHCPDFAIYVAEKGFKFAKLAISAIWMSAASSTLRVVRRPSS